MTVRALRPARVWSTPAHGSPTGRYWWWECRLCGHVTKDLIPSPAIASSDAVSHLLGCERNGTEAQSELPPLRWHWGRDCRVCDDCGAEVYAFEEGLICSDCGREACDG